MIIRTRKNSKVFFKRKLFSIVLLLGIFVPPNCIAQPTIKQNQNSASRFSKKSFVSEAVERAGPSIVTIDTQRYVKQKRISKNSRILIDPYFERFFGLQPPYETQQRIEQSQGSGFIFADGLVITNAHVIKGSDRLIVGLTNGKKFKAKVVGQDFFTDLAVLKLESTQRYWPKATLGDSSKIN